MKRFQPVIKHYDSVTSTNTEAARLALAGAGEGLCIIADEQTAGRGRLQRLWISPRGAGLYFSILFRPDIDTRKWPLLTLMAALAVHDALAVTCGLNVDIKWPNDILIGRGKVCGILAEIIETDLGRAVVVGIGINLKAQAFPEDMPPKTISLDQIVSTLPRTSAILEAVVSALAEYYEVLQSPQGDARIIDAWCQYSSYAHGRSVCISTGDELVKGITRGLEPDGALRVETSDGQIKTVRAGDVTG